MSIDSHNNMKRPWEEYVETVHLIHRFYDGKVPKIPESVSNLWEYLVWAGNSFVPMKVVHLVRMAPTFPLPHILDTMMDMGVMREGAVEEYVDGLEGYSKLVKFSKDFSLPAPPKECTTATEYSAFLMSSFTGDVISALMSFADSHADFSELEDELDEEFGDELDDDEFCAMSPPEDWEDGGICLDDLEGDPDDDDGYDGDESVVCPKKSAGTGDVHVLGPIFGAPGDGGSSSKLDRVLDVIAYAWSLENHYESPTSVTVQSLRDGVHVVMRFLDLFGDGATSTLKFSITLDPRRLRFTLDTDDLPDCPHYVDDERPSIMDNKTCQALAEAVMGELGRLKL